MTEILLILVCILVNGLLSSFEMGIVAVRHASIDFLAENKVAQAGAVSKMKQNLEGTLSSVQIGITVVSIISGALVGVLAENYSYLISDTLGLGGLVSETLSFSAFVMATTYLMVVLGELVPKTLAERNPATITFILRPIVAIIYHIFLPFVRLLEMSTKAITYLLSPIERHLFTGIYRKADEMFAIHRLSKHHQRYVYNLLQLQEVSLRDVLLPWDKVVKVNNTMDQNTVRELLIASGHTRVPVCDGNQIKGILNAKLFLAANTEDWQSLILPMIELDEMTPPLNALKKMQNKRSHMSLVRSRLDRSVLGIVTIEDIIEEVVGEIYDEDDPPA